MRASMNPTPEQTDLLIQCVEEKSKRDLAAIVNDETLCQKYDGAAENRLAKIRELNALANELKEHRSKLLVSLSR